MSSFIHIRLRASAEVQSFHPSLNVEAPVSGKIIHSRGKNLAWLYRVPADINCQQKGIVNQHAERLT
uniref:Uncharacterized protein n=1 Tax=Steinernema glaseri TaxID=37863 RepID=A0A1I7XXM0_9BILA